MLLVILMVKKLLKSFRKKSCKKQSKEFRDMVIAVFIIFGLIKKILLYKMNYLPKPYACSKKKS